MPNKHHQGTLESPPTSQGLEEALPQPFQPSCKSRQEFHKRRKEYTIVQYMKIIPQRMSLLAGAVSAFIISQYDPHHKVVFDPTASLCERCPNSFGFQHLLDPGSWACIWKSMVMPLQNMYSSPASEYTTLRTPLLLNILRITRHFSDPPPLLFLAACVLFGLAVDTYRDSHKADRYQDRILGTGILFGVAVASWMDTFWMDLKSYMAGSLILALVLSSIFHRLLGMWSHPRKICQEKLDTGAKLAVGGVERGDLEVPHTTEIVTPERSFLYHNVGIRVSPSNGIPMPRAPDIPLRRDPQRQI